MNSNEIAMPRLYLVSPRSFNALVVGSSPTQPTPQNISWIYILRGSSGRYYIGSTENMERRLAEHRRGGNHTTHRFGASVELVISRVVGRDPRGSAPDRVSPEAKEELAACHSSPGETPIEQPRRRSELVVGSSPTQPTPQKTRFGAGVMSTGTRCSAFPVPVQNALPSSSTRRSGEFTQLLRRRHTSVTIVL